MYKQVVMVRIISGSARGRILKSPQGMATRPTLDRTRESLFNILATSSFYEKRVLDIFAGTGALGLEAMSRGASEGVFIDVRTASLIKKNAELCKVSERCKVLPLNHKNALQHLEGQTFDYIFADPPYDKDFVNNIYHHFEGKEQKDIKGELENIKILKDSVVERMEHGIYVQQQTRRDSYSR